MGLVVVKTRLANNTQYQGIALLCYLFLTGGNFYGFLTFIRVLLYVCE